MHAINCSVMEMMQSLVADNHTEVDHAVWHYSMRKLTISP